jgi:enoyl-CoA hydratase
MGDRVLVEQDGVVRKLTLNRPDEGNILTDQMVAELRDAVVGVPDDCKVILLKGSGSDFCLGRDLGSLNLGGPMPEALALRRQNDVIFDCYNSMRTAPVPVVAMVQGRARGFGCALAAAADITIAAEDAVFQLPEMGHGVMPGMAMSALVDRASRKAFLYLFLSAMPVTAERALAAGLVSDIAPAETLEGRTDELLGSMLRASRAAAQAVKQYARSAFGLDLQAATDLASNLHATMNSARELRSH